MINSWVGQKNGWWITFLFLKSLLNTDSKSRLRVIVLQTSCTWHLRSLASSDWVTSESPLFRLGMTPTIYSSEKWSVVVQNHIIVCLKTLQVIKSCSEPISKWFDSPLANVDLPENSYHDMVINLGSLTTLSLLIPVTVELCFRGFFLTRPNWV